MAEIILPPEEETPETPQAPELNIDKPTENSKVITIEFEAKKTNKVSTKDTNQQLYTTDTDAWFEFKETSLEGANGTYSVVFRNRHDGSIFQRTGDVVNGVAYYKIPHQEIRHAGAWRGQIVYTLSNGDTTSREFGYDVKGHILDGKDVREIVVEDFETLMAQLRNMKDNAELELANLTTTAEANETDRQAFFNDLVEDIDELQANYQELLDTGVLQTNINTKLEQLEEEYAPKLTEVTTQLAQKADKGNVRLSDLNKNDVQFDSTWFSDEFLQDLSNSNIETTHLEDKSVLNKHLADKSVSIDKIGSGVFKPNIRHNLFDKSAVESGRFVSSGSGNLGTNDGQSASDFIDVGEFENFTIIGYIGQRAFYDEAKQFIEGFQSSTHLSFYTHTVPENVKYIRFSVRNDYLDEQQLVEGSEVKDYVPYEGLISSEQLPEKFKTDTPEWALLGRTQILNIETEEGNITLGTGTMYSVLGAYRVDSKLELDFNPQGVGAYYIYVDVESNSLGYFYFSRVGEFINKNLMLIAIYNTYSSHLYTATPGNVLIDGIDPLETEETEETNNYSSKWFNKNINFIGDSITAPSDSYASVVGNITGATIRNYGISNSTIVNFNDPISERYVDMDDNADLVLVLASRNDYRHSRQIGTPEDTDNSTFYGAVKQLFNGLSEKYPLKTVGILLPFKARTNQGDDGEIKDNTWKNAHGHVQEDYNNVLKEIAKEYAFPTFDLYNEGNFSSWNLTQRNTWFRDTIHPNSEGHKYLGQKVVSWIETI